MSWYCGSHETSTSDGVMPNCRRISAQLCDSWRCPTRTPLGDDVLPDVYCTKATPCSGSGGDNDAWQSRTSRRREEEDEEDEVDEPVVETLARPEPSLMSCSMDIQRKPPRRGPNTLPPPPRLLFVPLVSGPKPAPVARTPPPFSRIAEDTPPVQSAEDVLVLSTNHE